MLFMSWVFVFCKWSVYRGYMNRQLTDQYIQTTYCCIEKNFEFKRTHAYYAQVRIQMLVTDLQLAHFILRSPTKLIVILVKRDEVFISYMLVKLDRFYKTVIFPELVTRILENKTNVIHIADTNLEMCPCGKSDTPEMVCCDRCDQWYYFVCVSRKRFSKQSGSFNCKVCKTQTTK